FRASDFFRISDFELRISKVGKCAKSEGRRPRSERIPKSEGPRAALAPRTFYWALAAAACSAGGQNLRGEPVRVSGIGFLSVFGFRASDFKGPPHGVQSGEMWVKTSRLPTAVHQQRGGVSGQ